MPHEISLGAARKAAGLALARAERMSGTGASATVRLTGILKFAEDRSETELLQRFSDMLGNDYATTFPKFRDLGIVDGWHVTELEYLGDATFEDVLLGRVHLSGNVMTAQITNRVASCIGRMSDVRPEGDATSHRRAFLEELICAITRNAEEAKIRIPAMTVDGYLSRMAFVPTLCHRDLSVVNVMCAPDGGVRLIDPRVSVPGGERSAPSLGSSAIDVAAFLVSIERKELEREQLGRPPLGLSDRFRGAADALLAGGSFNAAMLDLCLAHAYSVYAACRCDYCLAPEREWLYDLMRKRFEEVSTRIA